MKRAIVLLIVAMGIVLSPLARPALAQEKEPVDSPKGDLVDSGKVTVEVDGSPEVLYYKLYRSITAPAPSDILGPEALISILTTNEYICTLIVENQQGWNLGSIESHVFASFSPITPVGWTLYSGSTTTNGAWCCWWSDVTNPPYIMGGYGQTSLTQDTVANGKHHYISISTDWHVGSSFWTNGGPPFTGSFGCWQGSGRISPPG